jgi:hypothetical protein
VTEEVIDSASSDILAPSQGINYEVHKLPALVLQRPNVAQRVTQSSGHQVLGVAVPNVLLGGRFVAKDQEAQGAVAHLLMNQIQLVRQQVEDVPH